MLSRTADHSRNFILANLQNHLPWTHPGVGYSKIPLPTCLHLQEILPLSMWTDCLVGHHCVCGTSVTQHLVMSCEFSRRLVFRSSSGRTTAHNLTRVNLLNSCRGGEYSMLHLHLIIRNPTAWRSQRSMP